MVQLTQWLLSWLTVSSGTSNGGTSTPSPKLVSSCSETTIVLANPAEEGLRVGDIFIRVDNDQNLPPCRQDCSVLFREILSDEGNGVYKTSLASFSQVFPSDTYDYDAYKDTPVESVLPTCTSTTTTKKKKQKHKKEEEAEPLQQKMSRRSLVGGPGEEVGPAAAAPGDGVSAVDPRGKDYDDDYYDDYDDDYYNSGSSSKDKYEDDYYYPADKDDCHPFWDATKTFIYDVYCIVRQLDCSPYSPGGGHYSDDDDDDDDDDDWKSKDKKSKDKYRRRHLAQQRAGRRRTQWFNFGDVASTITGTLDASAVQNAKYSDDDSDDDDYYSKSDDDDDHYGDDDLYDDDFFDDDYHYDPNGANFWQLLDAVCTYVGSLWGIFGGGEYPGGGGKGSYEDDYYKKDNKKDKHLRRTRRGLSSRGGGSSDWWSKLFVSTTTSSSQEHHNHSQQVPATLEEWSALNDDGSCPFTLCSGQQQQCFESQHLVSDTCRDSLDTWFAATTTTGATTTWREEMDAPCQGQDYCYASNVFAQTMCDEQFYQSLMKSCPPESSSSSLTLSPQAVPLVTGDLSEHCPLVSILLYSQTQLKSNEMYEATKENQIMFEAAGCHS